MKLIFEVGIEFFLLFIFFDNATQYCELFNIVVKLTIQLVSLNFIIY